MQIILSMCLLGWSSYINLLFTALQQLGRGELNDDDDPFSKSTGEARDDIAAMDREDACLVRAFTRQYNVISCSEMC